MKIRYLVLTLASVGLLSACGAKPLTEEQKALVGETLSSAGRTHQAVPGTGSSLHLAAMNDMPSASRLAVMQQFRVMSWLAGSNTKMSLTTDTTTTSMQEKINAAITAGTCTVSKPDATTSTSSATAFKVSISVTGDACPISMDVGVSGSGSETSAEIAATMKYEVKTDEFRALNDVDKFDITGAIKVSVSQSGTDASAEISGEVAGTVHSQKNGDVKFAVEVSVSAAQSSGVTTASGSVSMKLEYADFSAELKQSTDGTTTTYEINGQAATKAEFDAYFDKLGAAEYTTSLQ